MPPQYLWTLLKRKHHSLLSISPVRDARQWNRYTDDAYSPYFLKKLLIFLYPVFITSLNLKNIVGNSYQERFHVFYSPFCPLTTQRTYWDPLYIWINVFLCSAWNAAFLLISIKRSRNYLSLPYLILVTQSVPNQ